MSQARYRLSRPSVFVLLLLLSVVLLVLPAAWTDPLKHIAQFLIPAQHITRAAALTAAQSAANGASEPSQDAAIRTLERRWAAEVAHAAQLQEEIDRLRALRSQQLPPAIPLLDAKVVAQDIVAARDSMIVARGSSRSVSTKDWVASSFFVNRGSISGLEQGQAVLGAECLLGRVAQVSPYMARVQLLTDVDSPRIEVRITSTDQGAVEFIDYVCSLRGIGGGRMRIDNVDAKHVQTAPEAEQGAPRRIRKNDVVFTAPGQLGLPAPMAVGTIDEIIESPHKRLVYDLDVVPLVAVDELRDVYVIPIVPVETMRIP